MKFLIFVPPKDYRDESLKAVRLFLERWGVKYATSSYTKSDSSIGSHGAIAKIDLNTNKANPDDYDGIILVDGQGIEDYKIYDFRPLLDLINLFLHMKKKVVSIGNASKVLAKANIIKGRPISVPKDAETRKIVATFHGIPSEKSIEISENIITMSGSELEESMHALLEHIGIK